MVYFALNTPWPASTSASSSLISLFVFFQVAVWSGGEFPNYTRGNNSHCSSRQLDPQELCWRWTRYSHHSLSLTNYVEVEPSLKNCVEVTRYSNDSLSLKNYVEVETDIAMTACPQKLCWSWTIPQKPCWSWTIPQKLYWRWTILQKLR